MSISDIGMIDAWRSSIKCKTVRKQQKLSDKLFISVEFSYEPILRGLSLQVLMFNNVQIFDEILIKKISMRMKRSFVWMRGQLAGGKKRVSLFTAFFIELTGERFDLGLILDFIGPRIGRDKHVRANILSQRFPNIIRGSSSLTLPSLSRKTYEKNMKAPVESSTTIKCGRNEIKRLEIIGNFDTKFIVCRSKDHIIWLVDQHAADERCKYEFLQKQSNNWSPVEINTSIKVDWNDFVADRLLKCGFMRSKDNILTHIPFIFREYRSSTSLKSVENTVLAFSSESVFRLKTEIMKSISCHLAIKFGTFITLEQTKMLILALSMCRNPFECAHGRPTMTPLYQINH